ncbi:MAG: tripartite tricarboxylate transporter substrate binding protein, partial [Pseudomonadota bacterium]
AATPAPIVARANAALNTVLATAETRERLGRLGFTPQGGTPAVFVAFLRQQISMLSEKAREVGLEPQ